MKKQNLYNFLQAVWSVVVLNRLDTKDCDGARHGGHYNSFLKIDHLPFYFLSHNDWQCDIC